MRYSALWKGGILSLLLLGFAISFASAQERTVTGQVSSEDEGPIPGVNIVIQGTVTGAVSDVDGNYSITVPGPDAVLVFSSIGYTTQSITVGDQSTLNVMMMADVTSLEEIVVIGYGTQRKKELTSAIANVKSEEFVKGYVNNAAQLIQGKVAGLSITKAGANPNEGFTLRLRGLSTVGANTEPLIVIDGIIGGNLANVDPNDIESIDVLKDGSAAAIYGTRGSSGVLIVTTKKGRRGMARIEYNGYASLEMVAKHTDVMNAEEWRALHAETGVGTDYGHDTDWFEEATQTAINMVHNLSMSGGTDQTTYRASINYRDWDGIILNTGGNSLNGSLNLSQKALKNRLTVDINLRARKGEQQRAFDDAFRHVSIYNPTAPVRSDDPAYEIYDGYFQQILYNYYNPIQILEQNFNDSEGRFLNAAVKGTLDLTTNLTVDAFYSYQSFTGNYSFYHDKNSYWVGMDRNGLAGRRLQDNSNQLFETTIHWNERIGTALLTVLGGYSYQAFKYEGFRAEGGDFITDAFTYNNLSAALDFDNGLGTVDSWKSSDKLIAFFGRVNLNVTDSWFVTASARYEGSSRFGAGNKWGLFPAVGAGADLSNFIDAAALDNLKLRVSYGITGQLPPDPYLSLLRLGPGGNFFYNGEFVPGYAPVSNANEDLAWEKKGEINVGLDFSLLDGTMYGSLDWYTRTTTDLIFQYEVPVPPNLYTQAMLNLGELKFSGLELTFNWSAVQSGDFSYSMSLTPSYNLKNELVSLSGTFNGEELTYGVRDLADMGAPGQSNVPTIRAEEGKPIGQLWGHTFVEIDPDGNLILRDTNEDGTVDTDDRSVIGNGYPKAEFGFANVFRYKNLDANITFRSVLGHDLNNRYRAFYEAPMMMGSYNLPKSAADVRNEDTGALYNASSGVFSSYHVEDADFLALDNMSIGYTFDLPGESGVKNLRVYVAGNNLFYLTGYSGSDPNPRYETYGNVLAPGNDMRDTWFRARSVTIGVNLGL